MEEHSLYHSPHSLSSVVNLANTVGHQMNTEAPQPYISLTHLVRGAVISLLAYWILYSIIMPVTIWDAHAYNLARLLIVQFGGLFGNSVWNDYRQMAFTWTFDAIHYPFLFLKWGYALPSFACFIGIMIIIFHLVKAAFDDRTAWYCCLALLALPTVIFQATSTKNDLGVVFAVGSWYYALWRFRQEGRTLFIFFAALSLGFTAGAKSSGVPLCLLLSLWTLWHLRRQWKCELRFVGFLALFITLFGSVEIYLNNYLLFQRPLGPANISSHQNHDGIVGTLANLTRYVLGSVNVGYEATNASSPLNRALENTARAILSTPALSNKGYRRGFGENDSSLIFSRVGEAGSDFGPLGFFGLVVSAFVLLFRFRNRILWRLSAAGFGSMLLSSYMTGWMPWNMRFLMLPFILFTLTLTIIVTQLKTAGGVWRTVLFCIAIFAATLIPLSRVNKPPQDIYLALADRDKVTTKQRRGMLEVIRELKSARECIGSNPVLLCGGQNSWVLPLLQTRGLTVIPCPHPTTRSIQNAASQYRSDIVYILLLNHPRDFEAPLTLLKRFAEGDTALFEWRPPVQPPHQQK